MTTRFTIRAEADLTAVLEALRDGRGVDHAVRFRDRLIASFGLILHEQWIGASCDDVRAGYLRIYEGDHLVLFKRDARGVVIVRILPDRIDPYRHGVESD